MLTDSIEKKPEPIWRESCQIKKFPALEEDKTTDVTIVGGGITGITAAYELTKKGYSVVVIDANELLNGTTGHTTAKITAQHSLIYHELIQHMGVPKARLYYESNRAVITYIQNIVKEHQISCDFSPQDAILWTEDESAIKKLRQEEEAYKQIGIDREWLDELPLPVKSKGALVMKNQAQFHPLAYLKVLLEQIVEQGGEIYEHTVAVDIEDTDNADHPKVLLKNGKKISSKYVLICSHFPFYDSGFYFSKLHADRSYVMAIKPKSPFPGGMYLNIDTPVRSLRETMHNGEKILLVGGESHQTGQGYDTEAYYTALEDFSEKTFGIDQIISRWSAQDLISLDKLPYIGPITRKKEKILIATAYKKWGMTSGTLAAQLLTDYVTGNTNRSHELYRPGRFYPDPSIKKFIQENSDVAAHLTEGKIDSPEIGPGEVGKDEGMVVNVNGYRTGAYRDESGKLFLVDTTCTHMGCEVEWNSGDRTWDCPCHGSRFSHTGDVIEGPAIEPLAKRDSEKL
ncbi:MULTISPECIES: FAD-dependent oxidoreductase [Bacillus]|uniref:FAD-dependent oxidoreductase n=1 Tax=Bacillus TaxID=1386 RepID=UPI000BFC40D3|nr:MULTISPECIES: FAD-dependent oxidoreductase [Bacillus]MED1094944.1 FAD-dependent oxidoreductase [Bacillus capparidis]